MVRSLLVRGMLAGLIAGVVGFVFATLVGEHVLAAALTYEHATAGAHDHGPELVSRTAQSTVGLAAAYLIYGGAVGGVIGLVYAAYRGRLGPLGPRATAVVVTVGGFVSAVLVPLLKYPPNPPAATAGETIGFRTGLFLVMIVASVALAMAAVALVLRLAPRLGWWHAVLAGGLGYVVAVGLLGLVLPGVTETPPDFPAVVLYDFRVVAIAGHAVLWTILAVTFAELVHRRAAARTTL